QRFGIVDAALVRPAYQRRLHAAVLVAERDLEVEHLLAVALEAEVARLDHSGVHRTHRDLVHLLAFHAIEVHHSALRVLALRPSPGRREAHRLQPGMALGAHLPLLGDLALEEMHLRALAGQRTEAAA